MNLTREQLELDFMNELENSFLEKVTKLRSLCVYTRYGP